jgi:hypothetical protein
VVQVTQPGSGSGGGGNGNFYWNLPANVRRFYICINVRHSQPYDWNTVSNKFCVLFGPNVPGNINFEMRFNDQYFKVVTDAIYPSGATGVSMDNAAWHMVEWYFDDIAKINKCWLDGTLVWNTGLVGASAGPYDLFLLSSTWGGGGTHTFQCQRFHDAMSVFYAVV